MSFEDRMNIDAVVPLRNIRCTTSLVLNQLQKKFKPRRIYVLTKVTNCPYLYRYLQIPNLFCENENNILPNVSITSIKSILNSIKSDASDQQYGFGGHSIAGWYLQQFLKLGIGFSNLNITARYLVWDSDGIMLQNFYGSRLLNGKIPLFTFSPCTSEYVQTYSTLTRTRKEFLPHGFVIHNMIMDTRIISDLMRHICMTDDWYTCWIRKILTTSCEHKTISYCSLGFSEYETFARWSTSHHFDKVRIAGHFHNIVRINSNFECCPRLSLLKQKYKNAPYVVYEAGKCNSNYDSNYILQKYRDHRK